MTVRLIPGEDRYFVTSRTRDLEHVVDLFYQEEPYRKPHAQCSCESSLIYGRTCPHIVAATAFAYAQNHETNQ